MDELDGDPDMELAGFNEGYVRDHRSAEHRDVAACLAALDDAEEDDPAEDDGISNEDDDPAGGDVDDTGEGFTAIEGVNQTDWAGASLAHGDGLRHEDEEDDDPRGWRRRVKQR
ncbi:hypothetical protein [Sphingomonas jatrophae]|nr:hypothetical protein [Sphingomonas jatrophae]